MQSGWQRAMRSEPEPSAAQRAEARNGDARVVRAARMKAATRAEQRAQKTFVTLQHQDDDARHERAAPDRLCLEVCMRARLLQRPPGSRYGRDRFGKGGREIRRRPSRQGFSAVAGGWDLGYNTRPPNLKVDAGMAKSKPAPARSAKKAKAPARSKSVAHAGASKARKAPPKSAAKAKRPVVVAKKPANKPVGEDGQTGRESRAEGGGAQASAGQACARNEKARRRVEAGDRSPAISKSSPGSQ